MEHIKNEDKNQILYEKAKREWEQSPNEVDPNKTNEEVGLTNEIEHELHYTLHPSWKHKTHDEKIQTSVQKTFMIIVVVIGLAFIALWVYMSVILPLWCAYTKCVDVGEIDLPLPAAGPNFRP